MEEYDAIRCMLFDSTLDTLQFYVCASASLFYLLYSILFWMISNKPLAAVVPLNPQRYFVEVGRFCSCRFHINHNFANNVCRSSAMRLVFSVICAVDTKGGNTIQLFGISRSILHYNGLGV